MTRSTGCKRSPWALRLGLSMAAALALGGSIATAQSGGEFPRVNAYTLISGTQEMFQPRSGIVNFEAGDLVSGATRWDNDGDGVYFNGAFVGYLWSPAEGARVFAEDTALYWTEHFTTPSAIAFDSTVVGTTVDRENFRNRPFLWSPRAGYNFLPCALKGGTICTGFTTAITPDGGTAVGAVATNITPGQPTRAAKWSITWNGRLRTVLKEFEVGGVWSNAWDVSSDGSVVVGDSGAEEALPSAARWVKDRRKPMQPVGTASSALFTSRDGAIALGWATKDGRTVLARWDRDGSATVSEPPDGMTIESIRAINPAATAAVGALSREGNWAPFLWTAGDGFTVLPENGMEREYDYSEAFDVSDDGTSVVGYLGSGVIVNGYPPMLGFLWRPKTGLIFVNDLLSNAGFPNPDFYFVEGISGDGLKLLVTGNAAVTVHDTNTLVVTLVYP
jgi:hypothetical protein